ncbi:hypothetical protein, variant [Aphanomyces invadans]|uniref:Uncharacterized protein n=1 Tax=Aphanomyces invadans TaxID=157072 RepID=A0A024UFU8_9STRA|nr:hypothetical protein, variant [Aphanomyces invadans]ETW05276.1 hypothetical protein, variant [Aphanomyces invadans]|eukprot:XP_008866713.1 hypothetical protein, variant [Aphanomyces invadans]
MEDGRDVPPWTTIMDDLPFLIANDDGLTEQLTRVCDLLDDFPDDDLMDFDVASPRSSELSSSELDVQSTLPPPSSKKSKRTSFEVRQKHELQRLRDEVRELKTKLLHCESNKRDGSNDSFWKQAASIARAEKIKALHENEALHDAVTQQATFIEQMQRVFRKKPRLDTFRDIESESWQSYTLSAHASLRTAAIHAIADRQRSRMHHTFLRAGVLDRVDDLYRATFQPQSNGSIMFELVNHVTLAASYQSIGAALWQTMGNRHTTFQLNGVEETLEEIDACTVYGHVTSLSADGSVVWHSNLIRKYYPQPGKFQFVGRSVLDDALSPTAPGDMVDSKAAWYTRLKCPRWKHRRSFVGFKLCLSGTRRAASPLSSKSIWASRFTLLTLTISSWQP